MGFQINFSSAKKKKKTYRTRQHEGWMFGCTCDEFDVNDVSVENENNKYFKLERNEEIHINKHGRRTHVQVCSQGHLFISK